MILPDLPADSKTAIITMNIVLSLIQIRRKPIKTQMRVGLRSKEVKQCKVAKIGRQVTTIPNIQ